MSIFAAVFSKYLLAAIMVLYMIGSFFILFQENPRRLRFTFFLQILLIFLFHLTGFVVLMVRTGSIEILLLYLCQLAFMILYIVSFRTLYPESSRVILSHMLMFLVLGFIMLARLDIDKAVRQFMMIAGAGVLSLTVPRFFKKLKVAGRLSLLAGIAGIGMLLVVLLLSSKVYGANLSISIGPISFQPSEFVKISYVLLIAFLFRKKHSFPVVLLTALTAGAHVLILVWSTDLGGALIYAFAFLFMLYAATGKALYLILGGAGFAGASIAAYQLFSHVRTRVAIWLDPWKYYSDKGCQVCNSLSGIASGGLLGTGLYKGRPDLIPVVEKDFIFSAISEEMGAIIGICVILICFSCFIKFIQVASQLYLPFYRLIGVGLATVYGVQVFLSIGGNIKFIPATGVTLPFVSYGGSSAAATFIMFGIMQELFIKRRQEVVREEAVRERRFR